jgi:hypothetical protein
MPCTGNLLEFCGGPNALNIYQANSQTPPPSNSCLAPRSDGYGMITNGGFEDGFTGFTPNILHGQFDFAISTTYNYEGCNAA